MSRVQCWPVLTHPSPLSCTDTRSDTPIIPGSSYGVQKTIGEFYAFDYGRKGYLDTRSLRLPTVAIRTGAVS